MKSFLSWCLMLLCVWQANAQTAAPPAEKPNFKLVFEKAYLHTDREAYTGGEDIWFKAYLVNGQNNQLISISNNLYVELINPQANAVERQTIRMDNGLGNGDFHLGDSVKAGTWRIRAYTNWMRNFGDNFLFEKKITVYSSIEQATKTIPLKKGRQVKAGSSEATPAPSPAAASAPSIRFFPEGGSLVAGVAGMVAFKAEDSNGKALAATGNILSASGNTVSVFKCDSSGMGALMVIEAAGEGLKAKGTFSNGQAFITDLPAALTQGLSLYIKNTDSLFKVTIGTNQATLDQQHGKLLTLLIKSKGKIVYNAQLLLPGLQTTVSIAKTNFPAGISDITLYDALGKPQCERLVYVESKEPAKLMILTDRATYAPKGKVTVTIRTTDQDNLPVKAHLSLAAVDAGITPANYQDIITYLNLSSEIKGGIDDPGQYFDPKNPRRKQQLDLLLLTQGWRDFVWKRLADSALRISYAAEQGLTIAGKVRQVWFNKAVPNVNVTLNVNGAIGQKLFSTKTDTAGKFVFTGLNYRDTQFVRLVSTDDKGNKTGWVLVDTVAKPAPTITPLPVYYNTDRPKAPALITRAVIKKRLNFSDTTHLREVRISTGRPGRILEDSTYKISAADYKKNYSLRDYILEHVPGAMRNVGDNWTIARPEEVIFYGMMHRYDKKLGAVRSMMGEWGIVIPVYTMAKKIVKVQNALYLPSSQDYLNLQMDKINSVYFKHTRNDGGVLGDYFHIRVDAKPHAFDKEEFNVLNKDLKGYDEAREFYAPRYETTDTKPDYRTTIHWEPNITTNDKGEATITYYNADPKTKIRIVAEGISEQGMPVSGSAVYEVK